MEKDKMKNEKIKKLEEELKKKISVRIDRFRSRGFGFIRLGGIMMFSCGVFIKRFNFGVWTLILGSILLWYLYDYLIELEVNGWLKKKAKVDIDINLKRG